MDQTVTLSTLIQMGVVFMGLWGFAKVVKEVIENVTARHDREKKWDSVEDMEKRLVENIQNERNAIYEKYDSKLEEIEKRIDDNYSDTEAKFQQIRSELLILTDCMAAVLDGLKQQGCNGEVTKQRDKLAQYMRERAHE